MRAKLPENWEWSTIGEVCARPQYGYTTKAANNGKVKLLRTTDITSGSINWENVPYCQNDPDDTEKYLLKDGDIVISRAGSVGYSILLENPEKSVFASYLIRFKPLLDRYFFRYFLQSPFYWSEISDTKSGIALANVNAKKLQAIPLPIPPLPEQHRIVTKIESLFSKLDKAVAEMKKAKEKLELYRQSLLKAAFEGRLTEQWRKEHADELESAEELLARIKAEREKRFQQQLEEWKQAVKKWEADGKPGKKPRKPRKPKELPPLTEEELAELPELPEGWVWVRLADISDAFGGYAFKSNDFSKKRSKYQVIRIGNVRPGVLRLDVSPVYIEKVDNIIKEKSCLRINDVIITLTGTRKKRDYGFTTLVTQKNLLLNQRLACLRFHRLCSSKFFLYYSWTEIFKEQFFGSETGNVGQGNVGMQSIKISAMPFPTTAEQLKIEGKLESYFNTVDNLEHTISHALTRAELLRQSILKKAFSGKLVPQDPNDEPASELLKRIKAEREKSAKPHVRATGRSPQSSQSPRRRRRK